MHSHGRLREALFTEKEFASLSTDAKLFYGILLDRISLSKKNGWIDSDGYVYIIYTIAELQELLRMSHVLKRNCSWFVRYEKRIFISHIMLVFRLEAKGKSFSFIRVIQIKKWVSMWSEWVWQSLF